FFSSRRRHTILVSDWSSDVCSSDLEVGIPPICNPYIIFRMLDAQNGSVFFFFMCVRVLILLFQVPLRVRETTLKRFRNETQEPVHCSPPSYRVTGLSHH